MKILVVAMVCFAHSLASYERLGTELLHADRFICVHLRTPEPGEAEQVLDKIKCFVKYLRRLRVLRVDKKKKRAIRITDALFDQGRPKFLNFDFEELMQELKYDYGWSDKELVLLDDLIAEAERVKGELYRQYKYNIYLKYSTRKPLPY